MEEDVIKEIERQANEIVEKKTQETQIQETGVGVGGAVGNVKGKIVDEAMNKVDNNKSVKKHADELAKVANDAIRADIDKENLKVQRTRAENKAEKQRIKNELIALKTEAKRLKREKKQILREQRADHKKRNKDALWEIYKNKLTKMGYSYVPNRFVLCMLLFFDGVVGFFNGVGATSTAIMKALKWILIAGVIFGVLMIFPSTKEWLLGLLGF